MTINELKQKQQWINWKYDENKGKVPYSYMGYKTGTSNEHKHKWCDYETAKEAVNRYQFNGIGIVLKNGICGIDIDHKDINDSMVQDIINLMDTYTEFSPSGNGFHLLFMVDVEKLPIFIDESGTKKIDKKYYQKNSIIDIECYISDLTSRYLTFTGNSINDKPINERTQQLLLFLDKYMLRNNFQKEKLSNNNIQEIVKKIELSDSADKFKKLFYTGDITDYNNDDSRADLALCGIIARFTNNFQLIDEIMRQSKLYREKWERIDYKENTINKAIEGTNNANKKNVTNKTVNELEYITAMDLQNKKLKPIAYFVDKILPQGLTIICSAPKMGKSLLALELCLAITTGNTFLGFTTKKATCLYLALEDGYNRLKDRMNKLLNDKPAPDNLIYTINCNDLNNGFLNQLQQILTKEPNIKVIIIDTLAIVRSESKTNSAYAHDYKELRQLKKFADNHELCLILIHHTRKGTETTDIFEKVSGTNGITGTADTTWVIYKKDRFSNEAILSMTGRDVEQNEYIISFNKENCKWNMISSLEDNEKQKEKEAYFNNTLVKTIKLLVNNNNGLWYGSIKKMNVEHEEKYGYEYEKNHQKFRNKLNKLKNLLWEYDKIKYIPPTNPTNGERLHTFKKM